MAGPPRSRDGQAGVGHSAGPESPRSPRARPRPEEAIGQVAAVRRDLRDLPDQRRADRDRLVATVAGLAGPAQAAQEDGEVGVASRQQVAVLGNPRVIGGQLPEDRQRRAELGLGLRQLARLPQQAAEVVVRKRQ